MYSEAGETGIFVRSSMSVDQRRMGCARSLSPSVELVPQPIPRLGWCSCRGAEPQPRAPRPRRRKETGGTGRREGRGRGVATVASPCAGGSQPALRQASPRCCYPPTGLRAAAALRCPGEEAGIGGSKACLPLRFPFPSCPCLACFCFWPADGFQASGLGLFRLLPLACGNSAPFSICPLTA